MFNRDWFRYRIFGNVAEARGGFPLSTLSLKDGQGEGKEERTGRYTIITMKRL
jgi:hypothetical protein